MTSIDRKHYLEGIQARQLRTGRVEQMEIGVSAHGYWSLDAEAMRAVITGKVMWRKCIEMCQPNWR